MIRQPSLDFDRPVTLGSREEVARLFAQLERPLDSHLVASGLATLGLHQPAVGRARR